MAEHSFVKCEALKYAYRQTKEGFVVSFVVNPHEMPPELALAPVGTRVLLAVAEITDEAATVSSGEAARREQNDAAAAVDTTKESPPLARPNDDGLTLSAGAVRVGNRSEQGKQAYREKDEMAKAVVRASMLCRNWLFGEWICSVNGYSPPYDDGLIEDLVRKELGVSSRSEIGSNPEAYHRFLALETSYKQSQGMIAEVRS